MEEMIYELLKELDIEYEKIEHEAIYSVKNSVKLQGQQVKNLILKAKKTNNLYFIILHDEKSIKLDSLAEKLNEKRLSFASENILEELLKCKAGSVTAFGLLFDTENKMQVIVDSAIDKTTTVGFHPFVNTKTLNIDYRDFEKFMKYCNHEIKYIDIDGEYEL